MVADLEVEDISHYTAEVRLGDSRDGRSVRRAAKWGSSPVFVVTSPPYPTEHDYTRNSRLEVSLYGIGGRPRVSYVESREQ